MKIKKSVRYRAINFNLWPNGQWRCHLVARFGPARLVRKPDGRHELIGGTEDHRATAREWCSLFAPEIVFATTPDLTGLRVALPPSRFAITIPQ
jgi:hypothetical protein